MNQPKAPENTSQTPDPRAVALLEGMPLFNSMGLLFAFQALTYAPDVVLTAGFTRTRAADMVNEFLGYAVLIPRSRPPRQDTLEAYVGWVLDLIDTLYGRVEIVTAS